MERELICISCPRGCRLKVDKNLRVSGNFCPRGAIYGAQEVSAPKRVVASTALIDGAALPVCPVKTAAPIPKEKIFEAMREIGALRLKAPVHVGDLALKDIAGTGVDLIVTRSLKEI